MFRLVAKNTLAQGFGKIITILFSVLTTALLVRLLNNQGYGVYTFIVSLVLLFSNISDWGTSIISVRRVSQDRDKQSQIFGNIIILRLLLSVASVLLLNFIIRLNPEWKDMAFYGQLIGGTLKLHKPDNKFYDWILSIDDLVATWTIF